MYNTENEQGLYFVEQTRGYGWLIIVLVVLFVFAAGAAAYFYLDSHNVSGELAEMDARDYEDDIISQQKGENDALLGLPISAETEQEADPNVYVTPLGFPVISYSEKWVGDKLEDVYDELLNNAHGEEMAYISRIVIYAGSSETDTSDFTTAGMHERSLQEYRFFFDLPALIPHKMNYTIRSTVGQITLYNMDKFDSVQQAARTISHEYGHHYTMYYFMQDDEAVRESDYYDLRGIADIGHEVFFSAEDYLDNHEWDIYELAAEDYVQLMGSPNAGQTSEYMDSYDFLRQDDADVLQNLADEQTINVFPQENAHIPLADQITGLKAYYYSFIGETVDELPLDMTPIKIEIEKKKSNGYTYYEVTWNKPSKDPDALYTLVCFNKDGIPIWPVRTVYGDDEAIARVGTPSRESTYYIHYINDGITDEDRYFKVYLIWPDGRMQASDLFYKEF